MRRYNRLSQEEREKIYLYNKSGKNISQISTYLRRHKSTISRELRRHNDAALGYLPDKAHLIYSSNLSRNKSLFLNDKLRSYVIEKLTISRWSPEQIAGRLKQQKSSFYACKETIYKFIYSECGIGMHLPHYLKLLDDR